jgi:hypothetical protein
LGLAKAENAAMDAFLDYSTWQESWSWLGLMWNQGNEGLL